MISLRAEGLGKAYQLYRRPFDSLKELLLNRKYSETFWALRDVNLEVAQGGSLGIVGDNGAGKSTLVKLLAGAIAPSAGRVERVGRVAAVLTLGAGFHPDLSGKENIRIGCAVLGLSPAQTEALLPQIVEFSELGHFVERPVREYSSGMYLRLGFSVATAVNPDVLILDEHLAVGDQHFQFKCKRRIMALRAAGCSIVFCSHDLYGLAEVCDRTLWLRDGQPAMLGATQPVLKAYQDHIRARDAVSAGEIRADAAAPAKRQRPDDNHLIEVTLGGDCHEGQVETGGTLKVRIVARLSEAALRDGAHPALVIVRNDAVWCYGVSTKMDGLAAGFHPLGNGEYCVTFVIDQLPLLSGQYSLIVAIKDEHSPHFYDSWSDVAPFTVRHAGQDVGMMRVPHRWELE